jgi:anti-sigma regulatory factor (Ser/Thr protein kinase)
VNNAIEHAYQLAEDGRIEVTLARRGSRLRVEVRDGGRPMPAEKLVRVPPVDPTDTIDRSGPAPSTAQPKRT